MMHRPQPWPCVPTSDVVEMHRAFHSIHLHSHRADLAVEDRSLIRHYRFGQHPR